MAEASFSEEEIKVAKLTEEADYFIWKEEVVKKLHSSVPSTIATSLSFKNWQDIVDMLDHHYKNEK